MVECSYLLGSDPHYAHTEIYGVPWYQVLGFVQLELCHLLPGTDLSTLLGLILMRATKAGVLNHFRPQETFHNFCESSSNPFKNECIY